MRTTITVSYDAGWGNFVAVRGAAPHLSWDQGRPMESVGSQLWRLELDLEAPLDFKPCLNDRYWAFGQRDYQVSPGQDLTIYPHFLGSLGWLDAIGYIPFKGRDISVRLFTPPGYKECAGRRYPVVYCVDGQDLFEGNRPGWKLDDALNTLIAARRIEPVLVVGVDFVEPDRDGQQAKPDEFADFLLHLKSTIDRNYMTDPNPSQTVVLGAANGGLFALWAACRHPATFGLAADLSGTFWWGDESALSQLPGRPQQAYLESRSYNSLQRVRALSSVLAGKGMIEGQDLHLESTERTPRAWVEHLDGPLCRLLPWSGC